MRTVETALISALKPDFNANAGPSAWRFRPLGVPVEYAERQVAPELALPDFLQAQGASASPDVFFGGARDGVEKAREYPAPTYVISATTR